MEIMATGYRTALRCTLIVATLLTTILGGGFNAHANDIELPSIGGSSSGIIGEEVRIGSAWLKQYRRRAPTTSDPILTYYVENLLNNLVEHSEVPYRPLSLVITRNSTLNAFAVPGGIVGVNTGLFHFAKSEQQLASVLAHELAHLSQRHYARGVERQKSQALTTMGALLASILIAANSDGETGAAAISATQALFIDQQLRFSRSFEREADRIGMEIMVKAGMDPHAVAGMFEEMDRASRFSSQAPEFLRTHPLTTNRVVDAINLARKYPQKTFVENVNYSLVRARARWLSESEPQQSIQHFRSELSGFSIDPEGSRYGLTLALLSDEQFELARETLQPLLEQHPENTILRLLDAELQTKLGNTEVAIKQLKAMIKEDKNYYPTKALLSQIYRDQRNHKAAITLLQELTVQRPEDPIFWYNLAETAGLAQQISTLHRARAEYFILHANFGNARQQLKSLIKREKKGSELHRYGEDRLAEMDVLEELAKL